VALSGAGPSVLLILAGSEAIETAREAVGTAVTDARAVRILTAQFESDGAATSWNPYEFLR